MKPGPNLKQRSRGRNNNNGGGGGGKKHMPSRNQTYDSNGPDIRIRGNAHQVLEKYLTLARDATSQGDRIAAENYYQHAEHYFRVINSQNQANGRPNERPLPTPADDQMNLAGGYDDDEGEDQGDDQDQDQEQEEGAEGGRAEQAAAETVVEIQGIPPAAMPQSSQVSAEEQPAAQAPVRRRRQPRERAERTERTEEQGEAAEA
jgi:hypothetical protein